MYKSVSFKKIKKKENILQKIEEDTEIILNNSRTLSDYNLIQLLKSFVPEYILYKEKIFDRNKKNIKYIKQIIKY